MEYHMALLKIFTIFMILFTNSSTDSSVSKHFYDNSKTIEANDNTPLGLKISQKNLKDTEKKHLTDTTATLRKPTVKKWQVGRVSRKQYEIVNMLWRKTNVFVDTENISTKNVLSDASKNNINLNRNFQPVTEHLQRYKLSIPQPVFQPKTSSYIEFYYLDETDEFVNPYEGKPKISEKPLNVNVKTEKKRLGDFTFSVLRSPLLSFHINEPTYKRPIRTSSRTVNSNLKINDDAKAFKPQLITLNKNITKFFDLFVINKRNTYITETSPVQNLVTEISLKNSAKEHFIDYETCPSTVQNPDNLMTEVQSVIPISANSAKSEFQIIPTIKQPKITNIVESSLLQNFESTTVYDKIKFFEMYDTRTSINSIKEDHEDSANEINSDQKIMLEHVDHDTKHQDDVPHTMRHAKKHIEALESKVEEVHASYEKSSTSHTFNETQEYNDSKTTHSDTTPLLKSPVYVLDRNLNPDIFTNMSRYPPWTEYPFAAVYVYDRSQIHCDAAAISPHWLIASASCLSRHRDNPEGDRSAFVTYCSESWWKPERITYVKYSRIHPRFHPKDRIRKHLYNIGVIQVITSMASACASWAPTSIMSHHFSADGEGVIASAIGWGLDRYNTNYATSDLPREPLALFEGMVYSDSCPGNSDYRKAKQSNEEGISNVYCLTLPPYSGEQNDAVHGGLLLVGGKLVALYLQEERRQWGDQSAQYTGVWRLFPWVHDVANEPEENDFFL